MFINNILLGELTAYKNTKALCAPLRYRIIKILIPKIILI